MNSEYAGRAARREQVPDRWVLITGSSTGIGRAAALHLARRGWRVLAGVRRRADGAALATEAPVGAITPVVIDIADDASIDAAAGEAGAALRAAGAHGLSGLVNNAGIAVNGPIEMISREQWRTQFEVNLFGQMSVTRAFLPSLRAHAAAGCGPTRVVFISSIAGRVGQPVLGPYCASKHALEAAADALRLEIRSQGIGVSLIEPGAVRAEIWRKGQEAINSIDTAEPLTKRYEALIRGVADLAAKAEAGAIPASDVARLIERCLTARRAPIRRVIGRDAKLAAFARRFLPGRVFDAIITRAFSLHRITT